MSQYKQLLTPLASLIILTLGSALLTTFLSLRLHTLGAGSFIIGGLSTAYYAGMAIGSFKLESIILRVGHIRAYSACASILAVTAMIHGFYINGYFWLLLRFIEGVATAGLYIVIESLILTSTNNYNRGKILSLYMIAIYMAQSLGQWLLNITNQHSLLLYAISSILASLSVIPLSLTRAKMPEFSEPSTLSLKSIFLRSPSGVSTCFVSGLVLGSIYGLYPVHIQHSGYSVSDISTIMSLTIFGGMVFQYPIGKLSDKISRRYIIASLSLFTVVISTVLLLLNKMPLWEISILSFFLGGSIFCLYPIGISHTCDRIENYETVSAIQTLLLAYGAGAVIGPILAPIFDYFIHGDGILIFIIVSSLPLGFFIIWRKQRISSVSQDSKHEFVLSPEITPVATEIDPRS